MKTPINAKRETPYQGRNLETLARARYNDPRWATFREWISLGRVVKKGQKGTKITKVRGSHDGETRFGRGAVFNFEQTTVLEPRTKAPAVIPRHKEAEPLVGEIVDGPPPGAVDVRDLARTPDHPGYRGEPLRFDPEHSCPF